jgi:REP element-mobilizing transposase RayT
VLFRDDAERTQFLSLSARLVAGRSWSCLAYCLLSTHYHLLVRTRGADLAAGMQFLNGRYAQWLNWLRDERGHVFQARYHSVLVTWDGHLLELHRYIALNPVRASLVAQPEEWPWSSYGALLGLTPPATCLDVRGALRYFGGTPDEARRRLQAFVMDEPIGASGRVEQGFGGRLSLSHSRGLTPVDRLRL